MEEKIKKLLTDLIEQDTTRKNAINEIKNAEILHTLECDADKMEETVKAILNV